jgi:hypothetical protein
MKISNLDTKKYNRFFAFGCSFTNYKWATWADIIGKDIEHYENWAEPGAGNHFIFNSIIEADARHNFTQGDLVIVFWTHTEREDRYLNGKWIHGNSSNIEKMYGKEWVSKYYFDSRNYLIRDLAYIKASQNIIKAKSADWAHLSWGDFIDSTQMKIDYDKALDKELFVRNWRNECRDIYAGNNIKDYIDNNDVLQLYQSVLADITSVYKWFRTECIPDCMYREDLHPLPNEALMFIDWVWPDNTLSDTARQYANEWEQNELPMVRPKVDRL